MQISNIILFLLRSRVSHAHKVTFTFLFLVDKKLNIMLRVEIKVHEQTVKLNL